MSQTSGAIREQVDSLAAAIVELQYEKEVWQPYGSSGRLKSVREARYHLDYLAAALDADAPELFTDYLAWVKVFFSGLNFPDSALPTTLACTHQVLSDRLPKELRLPALEMLEDALHSLQRMPSTLSSYLTGDAPLDDLARRYLEAILAADRVSASRMILQAVEEGTPVKEIYLQVFQRTQYEIGRLWQINKIGVAQEHYCTAATQLIMSQLYPRIFATQKNGRSLVAACVSGELHEIGARMVADFFELDGWDTCFLGANMPTTDILKMISQQSAAMLTVSATMTFHVEKVRELISEIRCSGLNVHILVGGYPFNRAPLLWRSVGANGCAPDARQAVTVAERLFAE